jgi:AcrR family transcriptional regulator
MKDSTRKKILDVSMRLFSTGGLHKTKVEDIVEHAGISRATFYNYFHSKDEIFFCLIETEINKIQTNVQKALENETDPYRKIKLYLLTMIVGVREMIGLLNVRHDEVEFLPSVPRKLVESSLRRSLGTITEILDYGVQTGVFDVSNTEVTAHVVLSALDIYINPFKLGGIEKRFVESNVDDLLTVLCFGFSKRPTGNSGGAGQAVRTIRVE